MEMININHLDCNAGFLGLYACYGINCALKVCIVLHVSYAWISLFIRRQREMLVMVLNYYFSPHLYDIFPFINLTASS